MTRWTQDGRPKTWYGYVDFGGIQIPFRPRYIILTDRADLKTRWWLTYSLNPPGPDGQGFISITSATPPVGQETQVYEAYNEPFLTTRGLQPPMFAQLMVNGGTLGVDQTKPPFQVSDQENLELYARLGDFTSPLRHLTLSSVLDIHGLKFYSWTPYTFIQTPNPVCPPPCT